MRKFPLEPKKGLKLELESQNSLKAGFKLILNHINTREGCVNPEGVPFVKYKGPTGIAQMSARSR